MTLQLSHCQPSLGHAPFSCAPLSSLGTSHTACLALTGGDLSTAPETQGLEKGCVLRMQRVWLILVQKVGPRKKVCLRHMKDRREPSSAKWAKPGFCPWQLIGARGGHLSCTGKRYASVKVHVHICGSWHGVGGKAVG